MASPIPSPPPSGPVSAVAVEDSASVACSHALPTTAAPLGETDPSQLRDRESGALPSPTVASTDDSISVGKDNTVAKTVVQKMLSTGQPLASAIESPGRSVQQFKLPPSSSATETPARAIGSQPKGVASSSQASVEFTSSAGVSQSSQGDKCNQSVVEQKGKQSNGRPVSNAHTTGTPPPSATLNTSHSAAMSIPHSASMSTPPSVKPPSNVVTSSSKSSKQETLKEQKRNYRSEKKRAAKELLSTLKDPSVIIMAEWLKVRGSLKSWTKFWCVLKPGLLLLYKSHKMKSSHWVATVLLNTCELLERPSKKDGFCFKLFHPLDQSIWATKGPKGETIGALTQPLPYSYLIFRAPSDAAGKCWMDALELAIHCSSLIRPMPPRSDVRDVSSSSSSGGVASSNERSPFACQEMEETAIRLPHNLDESECERHFRLCDEDLVRERDDRDEEKTDRSDTEAEDDEDDQISLDDDNSLPIETPYERNLTEELGQQGYACQTEEVADEHKSLIWTLVKQVRPGMDLSKVVLPTFILEPRSFLDRLSDFYYHADLLSEAMLEEDPFTRIKLVVRWYLSGFYKKPKGLKKPYNPILGEVFRCYWKHSNDSRTFYIAEQISHHPPVSAFYVSNRKDGFVVSGSVLAKSKFYGNSLSAIMDGVARLVFLKRGEDYLLTMPYAHCKGILIGTLTMEMGGGVTIKCEKTGYSAELDFKLKPFLGSGEASNCISGKIRLGEETLATISGHWDQEIFIKDKRSDEKKTLWNPTPEVKSQRLPRYTVPVDAQHDYESEKLWLAVSEAIMRSDESTATNEKFLLEEEQRRASRERKAKLEEWLPRLFDRNIITGDWVYKYSDLRPWDTMNDVIQYERDMVIQTKTRHQTPIVHTTSIVAPGTASAEDKVTGCVGGAGSSRGHSRQSSLDHVLAVAARSKRLSIKRMHSSLHVVGSGSARSSTPAATILTSSALCDSESSLSAGELHASNDCAVTTTTATSSSLPPVIVVESNTLTSLLEPLEQQQRAMVDQLATLTTRLASLQHDISHCLSVGHRHNKGSVASPDFLISVGMLLLLQVVLFWWFTKSASSVTSN